MKTSKNNSTPIILFWFVPSISQIKVYKDNCNLLQKASSNLNSVRIIKTNNETLTFKKIVLESERFYGLKKIKGEIKKMILNVDAIKMVVLL
ncbi:hypothetical protein [Aestuariivivens sp. NBU2969]|uniref:hypothetical protein n=1 Tax=Aestuariivivens sp. NBU2969 TaxID=2873267 RepID=UPI001CBB655E|nr:hypothetical protein [Aestuariivivens sp. NBU2969]